MCQRPSACQIMQDVQGSQVVLGLAREHLDLRWRVLSLQVWSANTNPLVEERRFSLERRLNALSGESRHERTRCWQDTARLTQEFRTWFKPYRDLVQRSPILKPQSKDENALTHCPGQCSGVGPCLVHCQPIVASASPRFMGISWKESLWPARRTRSVLFGAELGLSRASMRCGSSWSIGTPFMARIRSPT